MKKYLFFLIIAIFLLPAGVSAETGNYIVTLDKGTELSEEIIAEYDLVSLTEEEHGLYVTSSEKAEDLLNCEEVMSVNESKYCRLSFAPNDPSYGNQWAFPALNIPAAKDLLAGTDYTRPTIVIIDTGYTFDHPDAGNVSGGKDYIDGAATTYDHFSHGTYCAGLLGAATDNGIGISGVCSDYNIIVLSIFKKDAKLGVIADTAEIAAAIYDAVDVYHADVISMSFGGEKTTEVNDAVRYAFENNTILVAAVGNKGEAKSPLEYPAAYDQVIGVANTQSNNTVYSTSSQNSSVFISAPGTGILTLANPNYHNGAAYIQVTGTSLAAPYIAALAAMARSVDPGLSPNEFKSLLAATSTDLETPGFDKKSGYGLANYEDLLSSVVDADGAMAIANKEQLSSFIERVNGGQTDLDAYLTDNINVTTALPAITEAYAGTFDGNGFQISGLSVPLFNEIDDNGIIKKLTVSSDINDVYRGGTIAKVNRGTIFQCFSKGSVSGTRVGGICATNDGGSVVSCINRANISGDQAGGIAGAMANNGRIAHCGNIAAVSSEVKQAGGICGVCYSSTSFDNCYNSGKVSGTTSTGAICANDQGNHVRNCFYAKDSVSGAVQNSNYIAKTNEFMKKPAFVLLLNHTRQYFTGDEENINEGFPVPGSNSKIIYFDDVNADSWFADAVYELADEAIIVGRDAHHFVPEANISRAEFVSVLARINGINLDEYEGISIYNDVPANKWYTAAINWATANHIAYGKSAARFYPNSLVSREEVCCFIMRYLRNYATSPIDGGEEKYFSDSSTISSWARNDVFALTKLGIINGFPDQTFRPKYSTTRSQTAIMTQLMLAYCR